MRSAPHRRVHRLSSRYSQQFDVKGDASGQAGRGENPPQVHREHPDYGEKLLVHRWEPRVRDVSKLHRVIWANNSEPYPDESERNAQNGQRTIEKDMMIGIFVHDTMFTKTLVLYIPPPDQTVRQRGVKVVHVTLLSKRDPEAKSSTKWR